MLQTIGTENPIVF